jgi:hypothetical protein
MTTITKHQKIFGLITAVLTACFCLLLYPGIEMGNYSNVLVLAILFFSAMFLNGMIIGRRDEDGSNPTQLSFKYHFITFFIVNAIAAPWLLLFLGANWTNFAIVIGQIASWGVALFFHWFFANYFINIQKWN